MSRYLEEMQMDSSLCLFLKDPSELYDKGISPDYKPKLSSKC